MSALMPTLSGVFTVVCMVLFAGIAWWAWSPKRRAANDEAAQLPFRLPDESRSKHE
ncbi:MAG: hypothetical protein RIR70_1253 [Pseudomonadota bacterium]|jgi:cytochrome c oxidase cbb3-type subunit 4